MGKKKIIAEAIVDVSIFNEGVDGDRYVEVYAGEAAESIVDLLKNKGYKIVKFK